MIAFCLKAKNSSGVQRLLFLPDGEEISLCLVGDYKGTPMQIDFDPIDKSSIEDLIALLQHRLDKIKNLNSASVAVKNYPSDQVVGRIHHKNDGSDSVYAVLNSIGSALPDGTALYKEMQKPETEVSNWRGLFFYVSALKSRLENIEGETISYVPKDEVLKLIEDFSKR